MNLDVVTITDSDRCEMCREERRDGAFLVLNVEQRTERREYLRAKYADEGLTGC